MVGRRRERAEPLGDFGERVARLPRGLAETVEHRDRVFARAHALEKDVEEQDQIPLRVGRLEREVDACEHEARERNGDDGRGLRSLLRPLERGSARLGHGLVARLGGLGRLLGHGLLLFCGSLRRREHLVVSLGLGDQRGRDRFEASLVRGHAGGRLLEPLHVAEGARADESSLRGCEALGQHGNLVGGLLRLRAEVAVHVDRLGVDRHHLPPFRA